MRVHDDPGHFLASLPEHFPQIFSFPVGGRFMADGYHG